MRSVFIIVVFSLLTLNSFAQKVNEEIKRWTYQFKVDEMSGDTSRTALLKSITPVTLSSTKKATVWLSVYRSKNHLHILLYTTAGTFYNEYKSVEVKFDGLESERFAYTSSESYNAMVITDAPNFYDRLKFHKTVMVRLPFYQDSSPVVHFNVENLTL